MNSDSERKRTQKVGTTQERPKICERKSIETFEQLRLVPGFLRSCSGMFPERSRSVPGPVVSGKIRQFWTKHPPRIRLFILLNSWDNLFVTLPSISSDTWVIHSSITLATVEFCDWLYLSDPSWLSLATAANFFCSLRLPFRRENYGTVSKTELVYWLISTFGNKTC